MFRRELRINEKLDFGYHVFEKNHEFLKIEENYYRQNKICRNKIAKFEGGRILDTELVAKNFALVKYIPDMSKS